MRLIKVLFLLVLLSSCTKDALHRSQTDNYQFEVEHLFTHDGCKVYRFQDRGQRYFTNCSSVFYDKQSGKAIVHEEIPNHKDGE